MPATVPTRGVLKASTNRVRTSVALQGNSMWENVIGVVNEQAGTNTGVEALINAPTHGGGRKRSQAARAAAAEAVLATGGFNTAITNYESLLTLAKSQGAVGGGATRGACKVCGQLGHLTKQCRNQFSKYYQPEAGDGAAAAGGDGGGDGPAALAGAADEISDLSDTSSSDSDSSDSEAERRRRRKEKKRKHKSKDRKHKSSKRSRKDKSGSSSSRKSKKSKKKRRRSSSSDSSESD